jgi:spore coat polysaccharide biosynthesis protein SpsF (cytidylyltransferase family)
MAKPYSAEPVHADINWSEEDNRSNSRKYKIWFEDIQSGFAKPHVRVSVSGPDDFIALIEVNQIVFEVRCRLDYNLTILAADVATTDAQAIFHKTLSERP